MDLKHRDAQARWSGLYIVEARADLSIRSYFGFASAVFKDRQEGRRGDSAGGLSKLNSMQPARRLPHGSSV
jgi:hypothetical protein